MPNYNTGLFNEIVDHAEELYGFFSGDYMNGLEHRLLNCGSDHIEIGPMQFVRILQYRRTEDIRNDFSMIQNAMAAALGFCARSRAAFGYFLVSNDREFSVFLATEGIPAESVISLLSGMIPDISFDAGFLSSADLARLSSFSGVISGDIHCNGPIADMLFQAFNGINGILGILAVPFERPEVSSYVDAIDAIQQRTDKLLNNDMTYNSQIRKINQRNYRFIPELDAHLKAMSEYFRKMNEDYWKTCIWFSCEDKKDLSAIGNAVAGTLNGVNDSSDKARVFFTTDSPLHRGDLYLPGALFGQHQFEYEDVLLKPSLVSYVSNTHISSLLQFPTSQVRGFDVIDLSKTAGSIHLFDINHNRKDGGIVLGKIDGSGADYTVSLADLTEHVLVTGATGTGKTNSVFKLVQGIHSRSIPTLIIEPSKKDYWHLGSTFRNIRVYSFGHDAELLRLNPLMPEEGVIIGNHIDSLLYAFSSAFEMEEPTRLALYGLLVFAYEQFGWSTDDIVFPSGKAFPKIRDLLKLLPDYCKDQLPYGDEVRNNICGSLVNRLSFLNSGITGESINAARPITGKELCSGTVLIELDDLSLEAKPFFAMLLMIKVDQYLRQGDNSSVLKNVVVLEEAHNVFAAVSNDRRGDPSNRASQYFSNMLSQIRGYGVGIIIADQGPSQINEMAISNTKVKIIQGTVFGKDMDSVAFALNLTDIQKRTFPLLQTGEAVIAVRGSKNVNKVKIDEARFAPIDNVACIFCDRKSRCDNFNSENGAVISRASLNTQRIIQKRFDHAALKNEVHSLAVYTGCPPDQELCLLGRLLSDAGKNCGEREKRQIIHSFLQE